MFGGNTLSEVFCMNNQIDLKTKQSRLRKAVTKSPGGKKPDKPKKGRLNIIQKREQRSVTYFLIPSFVGLLTFYIVPFLVVIYYSFVDSPINREFVFLDNFIRLVKNSAFRRAVANTVRFSLTAVPLAVILPLLLAIVLEKNIPYKSNLRTIFLMPMMVPVASIDWFKSEFSQVVVVLLFLWKNIGYNMILFMAALSNIPNDVIEVATLEGASRWQIFSRIKLRYLSSSILFVTLMSVINSFKVFREVYLLTGDYPYDSLYMLQHFMNNTFASLDYQKLSSAAILMSIAMIVIIGAMFIVDNHIEQDIEE